MLFLVGCAQGRASEPRVAPPPIEPRVDAPPPVPVAPPSPMAANPTTTVEVARSWFAAMIGARVDEALALSGVPFSFDRKNVFVTVDEVRAKYQEVADRKGSRELEPDSIAQIELNDHEFDQHYQGEEAVDVVELTIGEERLFVFVRSADQRVVGFSD